MKAVDKSNITLIKNTGGADNILSYRNSLSLASKNHLINKKLKKGKTKKSSKKKRSKKKSKKRSKK